MLPPVKRTLALAAAWTGSAVAAVGLGFLAVSLVGASASPATQPVASGASTSPTAAPTSTAPAVPSGEQVTAGGTVFAACVNGIPELAGAPAPGWWVDDSSDPGEVEFRNGSQKVEVRTVCAGGAPQFSVEGPRADGSGGGSGSSSSSSSSSSSPAAGSSSGGDDSSGRDGGGHGSDDSGGDDSSGRDGGGHGSDD
jgi:uncharacterized membrane protein YgcG